MARIQSIIFALAVALMVVCAATAHIVYKNDKVCAQITVEEASSVCTKCCVDNKYDGPGYFRQGDEELCLCWGSKKTGQDGESVWENY